MDHKCFSCNKEVDFEKDHLLITRADSVKVPRQAYKAFTFHTECFREIAGDAYTPPEISGMNDWSDHKLNPRKISFQKIKEEMIQNLPVQIQQSVTQPGSPIGYLIDTIVAQIVNLTNEITSISKKFKL